MGKIRKTSGVKPGNSKYNVLINLFLIRQILRYMFNISAEEVKSIIGVTNSKWSNMFRYKKISFSNQTCGKVLKATTAHGLDKKYFDIKGNVEWIIDDEECLKQAKCYVKDHCGVVNNNLNIIYDEAKLFENLWKYLASDKGRWLVDYIIKYEGRKDLDISMAEEINDPVFKSVLADVQKFNDTYNNVRLKTCMNEYVITFVKDAYIKSNPKPKRKNKAPLIPQKNSTAVFNEDRMSCFKFNFLMIYYVLFYGELEDSSRINRFFEIPDIESYDIDSNKVSLQKKLHGVDIRFDDLTKYKLKDKDPNNTKITLTDNSINYFNALCESENMSDTEIVRRTLDFELYVSNEIPRYDFLKLLLLCPLVDDQL